MSELGTLTPAYVHGIEDLDPRDGRLFGGKATGLARMARAGIPVPPAFAISTDAFRAFQAGGRRLPEGLAEQVDAAVARLESETGRAFGGDGAAGDPLLVSVRSGAQVSMPGMMDTVLNLGLDARSAGAMIARGRPRGFVVDSWMRFWKMYSEIVLGLDGEEFAEALAEVRAAAEVEGADLDALETAVVAFVEDQGEETPTSPRAQLDRAIAAVFSSWNSPRARAYREHQSIPHDLGTAVTVQAMVFGNAEGESGSGVAFSRNPNTGEPVLYGEYLAGRQGEDIVSGAQTPVDLSLEDRDHARLREDLATHSSALEALYGDAVDIEFTLESGRLYLLQVRPAKRTAAAAVRIAVDLMEEGALPPAQALRLVSAEQVRRLLRPVFDPAQLAARSCVAKGIGASPGQASGVAVLDSDRAAEHAAAGENVILVRPTTSPLDIRGMIAAAGILTAKGGALSHAAVVSRALDRACVVGCGELDIDTEARTFRVGDRVWREGDLVAVDGAAGEVFDGGIDLVAPSTGSAEIGRLLEAADRCSGAEVWATAAPADRAEPLPGIAVVNMADVAISEGVIGRLVEGISAMATDPEGAAVTLSQAARRVGEAVAAASCGRPVHIRLPQSGSARAHFLIPDWLELDQRLFLPLGNPGYQRAILAGLAESASATSALTVLVGGMTDVAEWRRYRGEVAAFPGLESGAVIQSAAGLEALPEMLAEHGGRFWIDLDEVIYSSHGFLPKAYLSSATLDEYVTTGAFSAHPRKVLKKFLRGLIEAVGGDNRVGVLCPADLDPTLLCWLSGLGFKAFATASGQRPVFRLLLGQAAAERL